MSDLDLKKLNEADRLIREIGAQFGLDFLEQEFEVVPARKMLEILAYRLPVNFSHWSFGRDYEIERTKYEHGFSVPYEVVFNSDPARAYLMETNPLPVQILVMAHVYAHNDFIKNNRHFQITRRDMISSASEAARRFRRYEEDYGRAPVEKLVDAGMAIEWNIDPDELILPETEAQTRERLYGWSGKPPVDGGFDDLLPKKKSISTEEKRMLRRKTPPEPTMDILKYVIENSPVLSFEWQKDILSTIRGQALYFLPYRRTKIMNEGWATFWHEKIMNRLFSEGFLNAEAHGYYNLYNSRVKAHSPRTINPYLLGSALFRNIEMRWNTGRFGSAYESCSDAEKRQNWDLHLAKGREKIMEVRRTHMDWFFIDEFLNRDVVDELQLYVYQESDQGTHLDLKVGETDWKKIKQLMVQSLMNWGIPRILVMDGNYRNSSQLYLKHEFEGMPLDDEYCRKTLEHIHFLWGRPAHLETIDPESSRKVVYSVDTDGAHRVIRTE
ncbi:MAG: SpoVR family protein [Syntrophobacteraceae bacterium]|nr:SpoVR family protein [Syntrophobacteraceae bacterium]